MTNSTDTFNLKICLIEDIIRIKRTLWVFGEKQHNEFIQPDTAAKLFDDLYEMEEIQLNLIFDKYICKINKIMALKLESINI